MKINRYLHKTSGYGLLATGLMMSLVVGIILQNPVSAASVTGFLPGNIMDDATFTNTDSMNVHQVQAFLSSKVPSCDTNGTQQSEMNNAGVPDYNGNGSIQRWEWGKAKYNQTTFPCLRNYVEGGFSAAQIIHGAAQMYGINPQVLIVLLQKEQGLVTDSWPLATQYRSATGYGCPDTAPCDSQYYGLTNQVQKAANMFRKILNDDPGWYTPYELGNNFIKWNPSASCGGSTVNIENRTTQALYNYTPYRPNQAALNAGYGMGDSCSAYGNRNFYLYFTDWFGPTRINSTLVRTISNGTVYLVSGSVKYPISSMDTLNSLNLGGIGFVSQAYLDGLTTGSNMGRVIRDAGGTVYYFDAKIKLPFSSCALVADYGYDCGDAVLLADWQIQSFATGPLMTKFYKTTSGKSFYIDDGEKREIFDHQAATEAGFNPAYNVISEAPLANLSYGVPVTRNNVIVRDRSTNVPYLVDGGSLVETTEQTLNQTRLRQLANSVFDTSSLAKLTKKTGVIMGLIQDGTTSERFVLTSSGKIKLTDANPWPDSFVTIGTSLASAIPTTSTVTPKYLIKSISSGTVYYLDSKKKRTIGSWPEVQKIREDSLILTIPDSIVAAMADGPLVLRQGGMAKSPSSGTVYYVDGLTNLVPISSFGVVEEAGVPMHVSTVPESTIDAYTKTPAVLKTLMQCGSNKYVAVDGKLHKVTGSLDVTTGLTYQSLTVCPYSTVVNLPGNFFLSSGTIYQIEDGVKNPISSWNKYVSLGGNGTNTISVSSFVINSIPTGTVLN